MAELLGVPQLSDFLKSLDHSILRHIFGVVNVADNAETDQKNLVVVPPDEHGVRRPVPPANRHNQIYVAALIQTPTPPCDFTIETTGVHANYTENRRSLQLYWRLKADAPKERDASLPAWEGRSRL